MKAAQFSVDAVTSFSHDLPSIAANVDDAKMRSLAIKLQRIVGSASKMYQPDPIDYVTIPHDEFTKETAADAIICATDIIECVHTFIEDREKDEEETKEEEKEEEQEEEKETTEHSHEEQTDQTIM